MSALWPKWRWRLRYVSYACCYWTGVTAFFRIASRREARILVYHGVTASKEGGPMQMPAKRFETHLEELSRAYRVVSLDRIAEGLSGREAPIPFSAAITFDDGYRNVVTVAFPILKRFGLPATVFLDTDIVDSGHIHWPDRVEQAIQSVTSGVIVIREQGRCESIRIDTPDRRINCIADLTNRMKAKTDEDRADMLADIEFQCPRQSFPQDNAEVLSWEEIRKAIAEGLAFGSHSETHAILTQYDLNRIDREVVESRNVIQKQIDRPITAFSYPNGNNDDRSRRCVQEAGYRLAVTVESGLNPPGRDPYQLRRMTLESEDDRYTIRAKLSGLHDFIKRLTRSSKRMLRGFGSFGRPQQSALPIGQKKIRVAHVVHTLRVGGLEKFVVDLICLLDPDRFESILFCLDSGGALEDRLHRQGIKFVCLKKRNGIQWLLPIVLSVRIRAFGARIVHTHNLSGLVYGGVAGRLAGTKGLVHTEHGRELEFYASRRARLLERLLVRLPHRIVAVSQPLVGELHRDQGVPISKMQLISNGVDTLGYAPRSDPIFRAALGLMPEHRVVGKIARLVAIKDHDTFLSAARLVLLKEPNARFLIVGEGPLRQQLEAKACELGIESAVLFLGFRHDIPAILAVLDLFVLSSVSEGTSLTILEAMASGCPIVATNVGGNPYLIEDLKTGRLVPPGDPVRMADAMLALLADPDRAAELGRRAASYVREHFGIRGAVAAYEALYDRVLIDLSKTDRKRSWDEAPVGLDRGR